MNGDIGLNYYIKDVVVRPEYQHKGIGRMMIKELLKFNEEKQCLIHGKKYHYLIMKTT